LNRQLEDYLQTTDDLTIKHCGTTALVTLFLDNKCYVANLGDTRAVLSRGGKASRLSFDHKPEAEEERIKGLGGYIIGTVTKRVNGLLAVSRSFGDFFVHPYLSDEAYLHDFEISNEDEFLIMACDGVWDEISDERAVEICKSEKDPSWASAKLRDFAYLYGSDDNISVIFIRLTD